MIKCEKKRNKQQTRWEIHVEYINLKFWHLSLFEFKRIEVVISAVWSLFTESLYERQERIESFSFHAATLSQNISESLQAVEFTAALIEHSVWIENQQPPWMELILHIKNTWNSVSFASSVFIKWPIDSWIFLSADVSFAQKNRARIPSHSKTIDGQILDASDVILYAHQSLQQFSKISAWSNKNWVQTFL